MTVPEYLMFLNSAALARAGKAMVAPAFTSTRGVGDGLAGDDSVDGLLAVWASGP